MSTQTYFYRMTNDTGFAPNPFYRVCTLATCTPNHMKSRARRGDVIVGVEADPLLNKGKQKTGNMNATRGIVYCMIVDEVVTLDEYFKDPRFKNKIPDPKGTYKKQRGDNAYFKDEKGVWREIAGHDHYGDAETVAKDRHGNRVFIAKEFYYFGDKAIPIPPDWDHYIPKYQGMKKSTNVHAPILKYIRHKAKSIGRGKVLGSPIDANNIGKALC